MYRPEQDVCKSGTNYLLISEFVSGTFLHSTGWKSSSLSVRGFSDKVTFALRYVDGSGQSPAIFAIRAGACGTQCCHLCQLCVLTSHSPLLIISRTFTSKEFPGKIYISSRLLFCFWLAAWWVWRYFWYPSRYPSANGWYRKYFLVPWGHRGSSPWPLERKKLRPTKKSYKLEGLLYLTSLRNDENLFPSTEIFSIPLVIISQRSSRRIRI